MLSCDLGYVEALERFGLFPRKTRSRAAYMSKLKLFLPLILLVFILAWAVPELLKAIPDRYVMRLPEPLRQLGLPESHAAILPTVEHPIAVQNLLLSTPENRDIGADAHRRWHLLHRKPAYLPTNQPTTANKRQQNRTPSPPPPHQFRCRRPLHGLWRLRAVWMVFSINSNHGTIVVRPHWLWLLPFSETMFAKVKQPRY